MTKHKIELIVMDTFLNKDISIEEKDMLLKLAKSFEDNEEVLEKLDLVVSNTALLKATFVHMDTCYHAGMSADDACKDWIKIIEEHTGGEL